MVGGPVLATGTHRKLLYMVAGAQLSVTRAVGWDHLPCDTTGLGGTHTQTRWVESSWEEEGQPGPWGTVTFKMTSSFNLGTKAAPD